MRLAISFAAGLLPLFASVASGAGREELLREAARLDDEGRCDESERLYRQILAQSPVPAAVLNNAGNHYLICGDESNAAKYFEAVLTLNPAHANANLQMARIAVQRRQGPRALRYLSHVDTSAPATRLLRAEALHYAGDRDAAGRILDQVQRMSGGDPRVLFALGLTCARLELYERAETAFNAVLATDPDSFEVLFNVGRAAARAKHYDRAQRALEAAVKRQPGDADALLELGLVYAAVQDYSRAVYVLAQARQRAGQRPDILVALARAAEEAGYYGDAALAFDEYLRIRPDDDSARRDHGLVCAHTTSRHDEGLKELAAYVEKHPEDPIGHFDMAQVTWSAAPEDALKHLSAALKIDPRFVPAYYARGWLLHRLGRTAESLPDLETAVRLEPRNVRCLDQLGLTYFALDRPVDAERVLQQARALAPRDPSVLLHLGRALFELHREKEAQQYLAEFEKLRPRRSRDPRKESGMIERATLSQSERTKREIERLRLDARGHPADPELQLQLANLLLADGQAEEAAAAYRELRTRTAESRIWHQAGKALIAARQYALAKTFLERATDIPSARLDLATATFFTDGPETALRVLETARAGELTAEYQVMRARILEAAGRKAEAEGVLAELLRSAGLRPNVADQAALLLVRLNRVSEAHRLITDAAKASPDNPDLLLKEAIVLALCGETRGAYAVLNQIESRWPEWDSAYVAHALLLEGDHRAVEARAKLQTAIALGAADAVTRCADARLAQRPPVAGCEHAESVRDFLVFSYQ